MSLYLTSTLDLHPSTSFERLDEEAVRGGHGVEVGHLAARTEAVLRVALELHRGKDQLVLVLVLRQLRPVLFERKRSPKWKLRIITGNVIRYRS